jgi:hypothetical protein
MLSHRTFAALIVYQAALSPTTWSFVHVSHGRSGPFVPVNLSERVGDVTATESVNPSISSPFSPLNCDVEEDDCDGAGDATKRLGIDWRQPTVWMEFSKIAQEYTASAANVENPLVNLGQGFPDWLPPKFAIDSLVAAVQDVSQSPHQYTRPAGHPNLVRQLAQRYSQHLRRDVEPMSEVAITVGASQALYLSLQSLIRRGDQVILFEPFFE